MPFTLSDLIAIVGLIGAIFGLHWKLKRDILQSVNEMLKLKVDKDAYNAAEAKRLHDASEVAAAMRHDISQAVRDLSEVFHEIDKRTELLELRVKQLEEAIDQ
jgi:hypothetical protein